MGFLSHIKGLLTGAVLAAVLSSCNPLDGAYNPQKGYWYDLEMPASVQFQWTGGTYTLSPVGYIYLDGVMVSSRPLTVNEVELRLVGGDESFLERDGFYFAASTTNVNHGVYYEAVWTENGATAHLSVIQYKRR